MCSFTTLLTAMVTIVMEFETAGEAKYRRPKEEIY